jgi:aldehyde:ferredoxin oxidoreductase
LMCCGLCLFVNMAFPTVEPIADFMRLVTGWDFTTAELVKTGERIANLRQAFNLREGIDLTNYQIPDRALGKPPPVVGPLAGIAVDKETLVKEFLAEMDWDPVTGKPSRRKLQELDLEDVVKVLYPR